MIPGDPSAPAVGPVVRPVQPTLGAAMAQAGKPTYPAWPMWHRDGAPPTEQFHHNHPVLTSPDTVGALPVRSTMGPSTTQLQQYLRALHGL
ncbi:MAG: hypothetical protein KGL39_14790 [Patescibacteria group bacterium]|nr:hypothetical protein [Patescibacteria group bacterium]